MGSFSRISALDSQIKKFPIIIDFIYKTSELVLRPLFSNRTQWCRSFGIKSYNSHDDFPFWDIFQSSGLNCPNLPLPITWLFTPHPCKPSFLCILFMVKNDSTHILHKLTFAMYVYAHSDPVSHTNDTPKSIIGKMIRLFSNVVPKRESYDVSAHICPNEDDKVSKAFSVSHARNNKKEGSFNCPPEIREEHKNPLI